MSEVILKVENVTQRFGGLVAVNAVNFELRKGEIVGIIGPNGAGKTTFFNDITGVYTPCLLYTSTKLPYQPLKN